MVSEWRQSSAAQVAIWHAGQVLRRAGEFPSTTLQNFYAVATYHAALALWTDSILGNRSPTRAETVISDDSGSTDCCSIIPVMLDREENDDIRAFCTLGYGTPGLSHSVQLEVEETFCTLADAALIMRLSADTLRGNLLSTDHSPPLLVGSLISLMEDLGSSPSHSSNGSSSRTSTTG
jgi:hypothetical protein